MIEIYTDGGCRVKTDQLGAWGFVVVKEDEDVCQSSQAVENTTNGFMEVLGMKNALKFALSNIKSDVPVLIKCDSQYVVNAYNDWSHNWAKNNWRKSNNKPIEHMETWKEMYELRAPNITVEWVRGHNGNEWNEYVDKLCTSTIEEYSKRK